MLNHTRGFIAAHRDPMIMRRLFETHAPSLFGAQLRIDGCDVTNSHYKTYRNPASRHKDTFSACHRVVARDASTDSARTTLVCSKAFQPGQSKASYDQLRNVNKHVVYFADFETVAWPFQTDLKLPQLHDLVDAERVRKHLPCLALPAHFSQLQDIARIDLEVVNFRPEKRCTTRYTLHHATNDAIKFTLYGKTFADDCTTDVFQRMDYIWRSESARKLSLSVARPLAVDPSTRTVWMEGVSGPTLADAVKSTAGEQHVAAAGRALASLHGLQIPAVRDVASPLRLLVDAQKKCAKLAEACAVFARLLPSVVSELESALFHLDTGATCVIHGDCHVGQFIANESELVLLDFDELTSGDPMQDLANFMVDLQFRGLADTRVEQLRDTFLDEYRRHSRAAGSARNFYWHALIQHINKAYRAYLRQSSAISTEFRQINFAIERDCQKLRDVLHLGGWGGS